jgi:hypothetical protein
MTGWMAMIGATMAPRGRQTRPQGERNGRNALDINAEDLAGGLVLGDRRIALPVFVFWTK